MKGAQLNAIASQLLCGCSMHFENEAFSFLLYFEKVPSAVPEEYSLNRSPKGFGYHIGSEILKHCLRVNTIHTL